MRRGHVFALALAVRLAAIAVTGPSSVRFGDGLDYLHTARRLCTEGTYPDRGSLPFFRAPLFPWFIAGVTACHPERVPAVKIGLAVADSLTCLVVAGIAGLLFASEAAATLAGVVAAVDPFFVAGVCDVRSEPLFMLLLTSGLLCAFRVGAGAGVAGSLLGGGAIAAAALARPSGLLAVAVVGAFLWLHHVPGARRHAAAFVAGTALTLLPWTLRNYVRFGEIILVNDAGGSNFWYGANPEVERVMRLRDREAYERESSRLVEEVDARAREIDREARTPGARSRAWFAKGLVLIGEDPGRAATFAARRALRFWRPWLTPPEHGPVAIAGSALWIAGLYGLGGAGLRLLWRTRRDAATLVLALFLVAWLAHIPYQVVMRFRIPFTDPLLVACAAGAMVSWRQRRDIQASPPRGTVCRPAVPRR